MWVINNMGGAIDAKSLLRYYMEIYYFKNFLKYIHV